MSPEPLRPPLLALPAPETAPADAPDDNRFEGVIARALADAGAHLVFRIPARPGSGYREIAALSGGPDGRRSVTLVTLGEDGATIAVGPADPDLAVFHGLARSYTSVMDRWTVA